MNDVWWYLARASGIVAVAVIVAALMGGLFFTARATGRRRRPNWWLDLHNYLGGLAVAFTLVHLVAVYQDELSGIGLTQLLVPFTAAGWRWGITFGVVATYLFVAVVATSWPSRRGSRRTWRIVHLLSIPAAVLAGVHAWMVGSSRGEWWFQALLVVLVGLVVYPAVLRSFAVVAARRRRTAQSQASRAEPAPVASGSVDRDDRSRSLVGAQRS